MRSRPSESWMLNQSQPTWVSRSLSLENSWSIHDRPSTASVSLPSTSLPRVASRVSE